MKEKTDPKLGREVREHLIRCGVETPIIEDKLCRESALKIAEIEACFTDVMKSIGLDLTDDSLTDTPKRVAKMYVNEIFSGLHTDSFPKCTTVENKMHYDEMVIEKNITCISSCEHHFVTIDQKAHVAYIP